MIDLTPLDVRNKRGDFKKLMRGYDPQEVDVFLELMAERLEEVVRENLHLRDQVASLQQTVDSQSGREHAVQEALVTAQELRSEIKSQAQRESDLIVAEAKSEARSLLAEADAAIRGRLRDAERRLEVGRDTMEEIERRRTRFLKNFRQLLERELEDLEVEEGKEPVDRRPIELDLGRPKGVSREEPAEEAPPVVDEGSAAGSGESSGDAAGDELVDGYKAEAEGLFDDDADDGEEDLFSASEDDHEPEQDARRG